MKCVTSLSLGGTSCEAQVFKIALEDGIFRQARFTSRSSSKFSCFKVSNMKTERRSKDQDKLNEINIAAFQ